jgi:hypothetical protein
MGDAKRRQTRRFRRCGCGGAENSERARQQVRAALACAAILGGANAAPGSDIRADVGAVAPSASASGGDGDGAWSTGGDGAAHRAEL